MFVLDKKSVLSDDLENSLYGDRNGFAEFYEVTGSGASLILHKHKRSKEEITDDKKWKR